jgi:HEAT repeat protein
MSRVWPIALLIAFCGPSRGQGFDEFEAFFVTASEGASSVAEREIKTLWRKIQIGEKYDRLDARRRIVELGVPLLPLLRAELRTDNNDGSRNAAMALARNRDRQAAADLAEIVENKAKGSQRHAALALGLLGTGEDSRVLLAGLAATKRQDVRRATIYALGQLGDSRVVSQLAQVYDDDNAQETRAAILLAAGRIGGPDALKLIAKGLGSSKESLRRPATAALADLRDPAALGALKERLADGDEVVVRHATMGLALQRGAEIVKAVESRGLLRHRKDEVRAAAAIALGSQDVAGAAAVALLTARLANEREPVVRRAIAFALARLGGEEASRGLALLMKDEHPDVLRAAVVAMSVGPQGASLTATKALVDKRQHESVRELGALLFARALPEEAAVWIDETLERNDDKKAFLEYLAELRSILRRKDARGPLLRARVQVIVDDLGGSPEWNVLKALHQEMLRAEHIDGTITLRGSGVAPGAGGGGGDPQHPRPGDRWNPEDEDMRLWYDQYPYFDRRRALDVP